MGCNFLEKRDKSGVCTENRIISSILRLYKTFYLLFLPKSTREATYLNKTMHHFTVIMLQRNGSKLNEWPEQISPHVFPTYILYKTSGLLVCEVFMLMGASFLLSRSSVRSLRRIGIVLAVKSATHCCEACLSAALKNSFKKEIIRGTKTLSHPV